jgi:hypothetical protein
VSYFNGNKVKHHSYRWLCGSVMAREQSTLRMHVVSGNRAVKVSTDSYERSASLSTELRQMFSHKQDQISMKHQGQT